ncbi:MAG: hypothetical protein JWR69_1459 [Pedosphaera sp.]|nr:hypothetical protein [Pedosphaera sp.]
MFAQSDKLDLQWDAAPTKRVAGALAVSTEIYCLRTQIITSSVMVCASLAKQFLVVVDQTIESLWSETRTVAYEFLIGLSLGSVKVFQ